MPWGSGSQSSSPISDLRFCWPRLIVLPADDDGEIALEAAELLADRLVRCDALILGPGMSARDHTERLVAALLNEPARAKIIVLDAAALTCAAKASIIARHEGRVILTPHYQELSYLTGKNADDISRDPVSAAQRVAHEFRAIVVLKGATTLISSPRQSSVQFEGRGIGSRQVARAMFLPALLAA